MAERQVLIYYYESNDCSVLFSFSIEDEYKGTKKEKQYERRRREEREGYLSSC